MFTVIDALGRALAGDVRWRIEIEVPFRHFDPLKDRFVRIRAVDLEDDELEEIEDIRIPCSAEIRTLDDVVGLLCKVPESEPERT